MTSPSECDSKVAHDLSNSGTEKWHVRYYLSQWATSHNWAECKTKKEATTLARKMLKEDPHSHAKVMRREPVTFANCFFRSLDS